MKICKYCGATTEDTNAFCQKCGASLQPIANLSAEKDLPMLVSEYPMVNNTSNSAVISPFVEERKDGLVSIGSWIGFLILLMIPIFNIIYFFYYMIRGKSRSKRNFCIAYFILMILVIILTIILFIVLGITLSDIMDFINGKKI